MAAAATAKKPETKKSPKPRPAAKPAKAKAVKTGEGKTRAHLDAYMKAKLATHRQLPVGKRVTYRGHGVDKIAGKPGVVVKHESRGGVFIKVGDKTLVVSPFALLPGRAAAKK